MITLHWIVVLLVMIVLSGVIVWGMRRRHSEHFEELEDSPQGDLLRVLTPEDDLIPPDPMMIEDRRLLVGLWGQDVPDMVVTQWTGVSTRNSRIQSARQLFLPLHEGLHEVLNLLESRFTDQRPSHPLNTRLLGAYSFIYLPEKQHDLVVYSVNESTHYHHRLYLMDHDGRLCRLRVDPETVNEFFLASEWINYRAAVMNTTTEENLPGAKTAFEEFVERGFCTAASHVWLAHFAASGGAEKRQVQRHLSIAAELSGGCHLARLVGGRSGNDVALGRAIVALNESIAERTDHEASAACLVSESLLALNQRRAARLLCEGLLSRSPKHVGAANLLRSIDQRERGAQQT